MLLRQLLLLFELLPLQLLLLRLFLQPHLFFQFLLLFIQLNYLVLAIKLRFKLFILLLLQFHPLLLQSLDFLGIIITKYFANLQDVFLRPLLDVALHIVDDALEVVLARRAFAVRVSADAVLLLQPRFQFFFEVIIREFDHIGFV